ncbi:hypothetical protein BASA61_007664, partial [Batrachochytrium salamandrivorans]
MSGGTLTSETGDTSTKGCTSACMEPSEIESERLQSIGLSSTGVEMESGAEANQ